MASEYPGKQISRGQIEFLMLHDGVDGNGAEFVYLRTTTATAPVIVTKPDSYKDSNNHTYLDDDFLPKALVGQNEVECSDHPSGVDNTYKYEWIAVRTKGAASAEGTRLWPKYDAGAMTLWAKFGERGTDGDGVEYVFIRTADESTVPTISNNNDYTDSEGVHTYTDDDFCPMTSIGRATDDPQGVDATHKCEWVAMRTMGDPGATGIRTWLPFTVNSQMTLWAKYAEDGKDNDSIILSPPLLAMNNDGSSATWYTKYYTRIKIKQADSIIDPYYIDRIRIFNSAGDRIYEATATEVPEEFHPEFLTREITEVYVDASSPVMFKYELSRARSDPYGMPVVSYGNFLSVTRFNSTAPNSDDFLVEITINHESGPYEGDWNNPSPIFGTTSLSYMLYLATDTAFGTDSTDYTPLTAGATTKNLFTQGPKTANTVLAAPNGAAGNASFRLLVADDIPDIATKYGYLKSADLAGYLPLSAGIGNKITGTIFANAHRVHIAADGGSWANTAVLSSGYDSTDGDYSELTVPGYSSNSARIRLWKDGTTVFSGNIAAVRTGETGLTLGNATSGNYGAIYLFASGSRFTEILTSASGANRTITLPNASGTVALTSDLSAYLSLAGGSMNNTNLVSNLNAQYINGFSASADGYANISTKKLSDAAGGYLYYYKIGYLPTTSITSTSESFVVFHIYNAINYGNNEPAEWVVTASSRDSYRVSAQKLIGLDHINVGYVVNGDRMEIWVCATQNYVGRCAFKVESSKNFVSDFSYTSTAPSGFVAGSKTTVWDSGNSNSASVPWSASSLNLAGAISGATSIDSLLYFDTNNTSVEVNNTINPYSVIVIGHSGYTHTYLNFAPGGTTAFQFDGMAGQLNINRLYSGNWYRPITILNSSASDYIGINNSAPSYTLDVSGSIRATSQLVSTVATGTAPLSVSSTTRVDNLNVQYFDGYKSADMMRFISTNTYNSQAGIGVIGVSGASDTPYNWGSVLQWCNGNYGYAPASGVNHDQWYSQLVGLTNDELYFRTSTNGGSWTAYKRVWTSGNSNKEDVSWTAHTYYFESADVLVHSYTYYANRTILSIGWDGTNGDYTDITVAGYTSNTARLRFTRLGYLGVGVATPGYAVDVAGVIHATTGILSEGYGAFGGNASSSDERLKDNIKDILDPMDIIMRLRPRVWDWNQHSAIKGHAAGYVAQEVEPVLDYVVGEMPSEYFGKQKTLHYDMFHALWGAGIQDQERRLVSMGKSLEAAKNTIEEQERRIGDLEQEIASLKLRISA